MNYGTLAAEAEANAGTTGWPLHAHGLYWLYLFAVASGLDPFPADFDPYALQTESGSLLTRVYFLALLVAVAFVVLMNVGRVIETARRVRGLLLPLLVAGTLFLVSSLFSPVPALALTKLGFAVTSNVILVGLFLAFPDIRSMVISTGIFLAAALAACFAGVLLYPDHAIHQTSLYAGAWRGLYSHKNYAGGIMSLSVLVFAACKSLMPKQSFWWTGLIGLALVFLWFTQSKTALIALGLSFGIAFVLTGRSVRRGMLWLALPLVVFAGTFFVFAPALAETLGLSGDLTGRLPLWRLLLSLTGENLLLGSGYDSFFNTGAASPLFATGGAWSRFAPHAHNGYFNIYIFGGAGALLAALWLFVAIYAWGQRLDFRGLRWARWMLAIVTFEILRNITEVDIFAGDRLNWSLTLLAGMALFLGERDARD